MRSEYGFIVTVGHSSPVGKLGTVVLKGLECQRRHCVRPWGEEHVEHSCTQSHVSSYEPVGEKLGIGRKWTEKMEGLKASRESLASRKPSYKLPHLPPSEFHVKTTSLPLTEMDSRECYRKPWQNSSGKSDPLSIRHPHTYLSTVIKYISII